MEYDKENSNEAIGDKSMHATNSRTNLNHSRRSLFVEPKGGKKKIGGFGFLQNQITQLITTCTNVTSKLEKSSRPPSLFKAITLLDQIIKIYEDILLYLHSTKLIEDVNKRETFMTIVLE